MTHVYVVAVVIILSAKDETRGSGVKISWGGSEGQTFGLPQHRTVIQETAVRVKPKVSADFLQLPRVDMSCYVNKVCK